ncbi:phage portal protein [Sphingomonas histidinilytica]|uniref:phage portal protein n=1 Tax=Rhizorhabdus histidinilytica TaxID=439228 RepID=UPI001AD97825|nr:phage portal protein [Rhizorhabdus histidinilytica]MBO9380252.1 phage portal protein [Rhizorhabdus histidinilytica]
MRAVMSSQQYMRNGISGTTSRPTITADRPAPEEVTESPFTDGRFWGDEFFGFQPLRVATAEQAAKNAAVNFCCSTIAEAVGGVPLEIFEGDALAVGFELGEVLSEAPNPLQIGPEFWAAMAFSNALRGWAFAEPTMMTSGLALWPLSPVRTVPEWGERSLRVTYTPEAGVSRVLGPADLFWFTNSADGSIEPMAPWKMAKGTIDFAMAIENHGRTSFQNGNRPGGVLHSDQALGDEVIERLKASMRAWRNGGNAVLEQGLKYQAVQSSNRESTLLELIEQLVIQLSRYWRIPLSLISPSFAGKAQSEQQSGDFVKYVIRPLTRRIEKAITYRLLTPDMRRRGLRAKFNLDALLRGDSSTQARNAVLYRTATTHSVNDVRTRVFGMPKINEPWADDPREPLNSNRAADTTTGGDTAPQDNVGTEND